MPHDRSAGNPLEWLKRAKGDLRLAERYEKGIYYEDLCFHCQQAAEKAIKAVLVFKGISFVKTHDVKFLLSLLPESLASSLPLAEVTKITRYAVSTRYPGEFEPVTRADWKRALKTADKVIKWSEKIISELNI